MSTTRRNLVRRSLGICEAVVRPTAVSRVDRDAGIIYGVKILGPDSANDRKYLPEAITDSVRSKVYEGAPCNINHPLRPTDRRASEDRFGRFINVREEPDGLYGDLQYLKTHPMAERVCEAAERMPGAFGFSHNADIRSYRENGIEFVQQIVEVRSVDLVADPATTHGLFEDRSMPRTVKKKAFLEGALKKLKASTKVKNNIRRVLEMDAMPTDAEMPVEPDADDTGDADPAEALKAGFKASAVSLLDAALDGDQDALKKLVDLIKSHAKINPPDDGSSDTSSDTSTEEDDSSDAPPGKDDDKKDDKMESKLAKRLADLERKDRVRSICEDAGIKVDKTFIETLMEAGSDRAVKALVDREKQLQQQGKGRSGPPRSRPAGGAVSVTEDKIPDDPKALGRWLKA